VGLTSPLGKNTGENWSSVKAMKTGIIHEPKEDLPDYLQYMGRVPEYLLIAGCLFIEGRAVFTIQA